MGYRPRIERGAATYDLPLPLRMVRERHTRKVTSAEVPLQDGVLVSNSVLGALQVSFAGLLCVNNPQDDTPITSIMEGKENLEEYLIEDDEPFIFYRFIEGATVCGIEIGPASAGTRWYQDCICTSLTFDFTHQTVVVLPYSFALLVPDGKEWKHTA